MALVLLLSVLLTLHHWFFEPLMTWGVTWLEWRALPWLGLACLAWLLAGRGPDKA